MWSRQFIQKAAKYIDEVQVSIDGFDAESYRAVRGSNAFGDVLVSVNRLVEAGIRVTVAVTPLLDTLLGNEKRYVDFAKDLLARYKGKEFFVKFNTELMDGRDITPTEEENDLYRAAMKSNRNRAAVTRFRSHSCCGNYIAGGRSVYNMCRLHIPIPSAGGRSAGAIRMR